MKHPIEKMRSCLALLPPPGGEVVAECLDEIEMLHQQLAAAQERKQIDSAAKSSCIFAPEYGIAEKFASLVFDLPGWYRGTIDYALDENGKVVRVDELKVTMTVEQTPRRFFKEQADKPETRWVPCEEPGRQKMQHNVDGMWKDVQPFWID